jgi:hypothetical protein
MLHFPCDATQNSPLSVISPCRFALYTLHAVASMSQRTVGWNLYVTGGELVSVLPSGDCCCNCAIILSIVQPSAASVQSARVGQSGSKNQKKNLPSVQTQRSVEAAKLQTIEAVD